MTRQYTAAQIEDMNLQYSPRLTVPDADDYLQKSAEKSAEVRQKLNSTLDISYGDTAGQKLDIFPAADKNAPVHVFIHGGYWRALDKDHYSHLAAPLVNAGATTVLVNYDLCPAVRVSDIVKQVRRSIIYVHGAISDFNGDPDKLYVSGHSAGGHLAAMMIATDWSASAGLDPQLIKGSVLLSGLFDIEPHRHLDIQADINLTADEAREMSPMGWPAVVKSPVLLAVGEHEPNLFHWQSLAYAAHLRTNSVKAEYLSMSGDNHFSITDRLGNADDPLTQLIIAQMRL